MTRLTDEKYWNDGYKGIQLSEATEGPLADLLNTYVDKVENKACIEIGSFPGTYLPVIGRKGYSLSGIDFNERNKTDLPGWLSHLGLKVDGFYSGDFFEFVKNENKKYDLVCSFGFIEHFENYLEVIQAHLDMVAPGGKIIITTPNFKGWMQYFPHLFFDKENLAKHNVKSMAPDKWKLLIESNNFKVTWCGYFGKYYFWYDPAEHRSKIKMTLLKNVNRLIFNLNKLIKKSGKESRAYSAFCGIVAEKK
ncbi:MAG: class I SAM-dependent methyltransferase [Ferruginibacter sp.]